MCPSRLPHQFLLLMSTIGATYVTESDRQPRTSTNAPRHNGPSYRLGPKRYKVRLRASR